LDHTDREKDTSDQILYSTYQFVHLSHDLFVEINHLQHVIAFDYFVMNNPSTFVVN